VTNQNGWVFSEVEYRDSFAFCAAQRGAKKISVLNLNGSFLDCSSFERAVEFCQYDVAEVLSWTPTASFSILPSADSIEVFRQLRRAPNLALDPKDCGEWKARPDRELDGSKQKSLFDMTSKSKPDGYWPVYKGESFNIWNPDTGIYLAWADPDPVKKFIFNKRKNSRKNSRNAHSEFPESHHNAVETLACHSPRIAFRDIARSTDRRTMIPCLVPPEIFSAHKAPCLLWPCGDEKDQAYLLGVLSSIPLDWFARCFVEKNMSFYILNSLPIPRPNREDPLWKRIVSLSARLACADKRFWDWTKKAGEKPADLDGAQKEDMIHELDAVVAHLYGLSESQLAHIFETFHVGWDFSARLEGVRGHYREWKKKLKDGSA